MKRERKIHYEFSVGTRWTHWIRFFCIAILTFTGFYISYGFISPEITDEPVVFLNAKFRFWHVVFGFVLIAVTILKSYLFVLNKRSSRERWSIVDVVNPIIWWKQIKFYLYLGEHPHLKGVYNPLQFVAYIGLYVMIYLIILTGIILYVHTFHEGLGGFLYESMRYLELFFGGLANVRAIHHILTWAILIFSLIHVYMAIFNACILKEGSIDAIVSGYKFEKIHDKKS